MKPTAGPGLRDTGEFIAISVANEVEQVRGQEDKQRIKELEATILDMVDRIHSTYHTPKGVAKRPWQACHRTSCRLAYEILKEGGNGQEVQGGS